MEEAAHSPLWLTENREAETEYKVLESFGDKFAMLEVRPLTGRTHQIRVHLAYIGYPIVGDKIYGRRKQQIELARHFLHAHRLRFVRPSDKTEIALEAELPAELQTVLDRLNA